MGSDDGDAAGDVIEPARSNELIKLIALCAIVFLGLALVGAMMPPDKQAGFTVLAAGLCLLPATIVVAWYVRYGSHRLVVTADELHYIRGKKTERYRRSTITNIEVGYYVRSRAFAVCTANKRLIVLDAGWWGRKSAEQLADLLAVPLSDH